MTAPVPQLPGAPEPEGEVKLTFMEHLRDLRVRLLRASIGVVVGMAAVGFYVPQVVDRLMAPVRAALPEGKQTLVYTSAIEPMMVYIKVGIYGGLFIAAPWILWQVWLFIAPGLYAREKKLAIPFVVLASFGFVGGAAFSHYVLFPWMWQFFASFADDELTFLPKIAPVFSLYMKMLLGMGLVFQMPALVYPLARMGLVTARFLVRHFKYAVLIIFIAAAVITPSGDPMTQTLMAAPMVALYLISIVIAFIFGKKRTRTAEPADATAD